MGPFARAGIRNPGGRLAAGDNAPHLAGQGWAGGPGSCLVITLSLRAGIPDGHLRRRRQQAGSE